jgi:hypothetical protein
LLYPRIAFLRVLGFFSLYLLYTGAPIMGVPRERATAFTVAVFACTLGLMVAFAALPWWLLQN